MNLLIRVFRNGDEATIAEIFTAAIHEIACEVYTPAQCEAWCAREVNYEHWRKRCELKRPFVAEVEGQIAGFLELDPDGHIDCAYINPKFQRRGIMTQLVQHAVATCFAMQVPRVYVEASICARPLFEKAGFRLLHPNLVARNGEELLNYSMVLRR